MKTLLAAVLCVVLPMAVAHAQAAAMPVSMGINVDGVSDYAVESYFVDAMKQSRHWGTVSTPWDQAAAVDTLGWPTQDAGVIVLCCIADAAGHSVIAGSYALSFTGQADVSLEIWAGSVTGMQYDAASNTSTATVTLADSGAGTSLYLGFTNSRRTATAALNTGVTGVVLRRSQLAPVGQSWWTSQTQIFTTPYLNLIAGYSTLRFMDWTNTNGNTVTNWGQRTTPADASQQAPAGAAWEYAIALANAVHHDMWINIPDMATDDYVTRLATLVHATLDPSLNVYTEYSNEVWNYSFAQAGRNQAAAEAQVAADPQSPLALGCADYGTCRYLWGERRIGQRDIQIGAIFTSVFGADAARVRPIYATQLGQTYFVSQTLSMIAAAYGPPASLLYAIAQAPYFTGDNSIDGQTSQQLLSAAAANLDPVGGAETAFAAYALTYGLRSVTYEGGPGLSGTPSLDAKVAANRSTRMGRLVQKSLRQAFGDGTSLYMYFNDAGQYSQYGMWGTTEDVLVNATPKIQAIQAVQADAVEPLTAGHKVPIRFTATTPDIDDNGGYIVANPAYAYIGNGNSYGYLINVPAAGSYQLWMSTANYAGATTAIYRIDQSVLATTTVPAGTGPGSWKQTPHLTATLAAGLHVLTVVAPGAGFAIQSIAVATP